ncbi:mitochondrial metal transporter 2 [Neurospora crassa OR74A]|uniref:Mitochondrial metal transporter 2 n=1 Tax=Neurospora crassa (strain ATCC 24698 / 74-OR23-1A / CBS 708.71 / DSM 1257 / FGSC 987) TaxID=367110 RepID=Q7SB14_NEUCR|nr:mitochondrial metal transporter 2 [Neurospora crassa OR74A]EAA33576.3 mitochondrial metal transporter 2 [Neurospora crassa OR74A]|eukprot:XP_962812.3 mitochondrial metal transporter 2 [Neurospora crassa OR74A]
MPSLSCTSRQCTAPLVRLRDTALAPTAAHHFHPAVCVSKRPRSLLPFSSSATSSRRTPRLELLLQRQCLGTHTSTTTPTTTTPIPPSRCFDTYSNSRSFEDRLRRSLIPVSSSSNPPYPSLLSQLLRPRRRTATTTTTAVMTTPTQSRGHAGHSHGLGHHHHHHDNVYLTSRNKADAGVRITRIGLYSNLGMAIAKGLGGYAFNSQSMVADAWHSLTDLASDILTLATVSWSLRPPTENFPLGFGKVESLGSLGVSSMLLFGGLFMCMNSCTSLYAHFFLDPAAAAQLLEHAHGHGHGHHHHHGVSAEGPSLHAAWLAAGTVAVKEWLYHATMKVARERKSSVLASNAVHHRVDSLTGIVTLAAILGANFLHNASWLDPVGGLLISLLVIKAGYSNTVSALYELADRSVDDEVKHSVRKQCLRALQGVSEGHEVEVVEITGVKSGQNYLLDIELAVPNMWTVEDVREVEDAVRTQVGAKVRGARKVRIRFVPKEDAAAKIKKFDEFIPGDVSPKTSPEPEEEEVVVGEEEEHEHDHDHEHHKHK